MKINKFAQKGLSAIEILLIISAIGVISVGGFYAYQSFTKQNAIQSDIQNIEKIWKDTISYVSATKTISASHAKGFTGSDLIKYKIAPEDMFIDGNLLKSNIAESIKFSTISNNKDGFLTHFKFEFKDFENKYCKDFLIKASEFSSFIGIDKHILKNNFDPNNPQNFDLAKMEEICLALSTEKETYPVYIIYSNEDKFVSK